MRAAAAVAAALAAALPPAAAENCKWRWASANGTSTVEVPQHYRAYDEGQAVVARGSFAGVPAGAVGKVTRVPRPGAVLDVGAVARVQFGSAAPVDVQPAMIRPAASAGEALHIDWARRLPRLHDALVDIRAREQPRGRHAAPQQFAPGKIPTQDRTCATMGLGWRDASYGLMSNTYDVGEPILGATLEQCIDICARRYDSEWMPSERCYGFSRQRNISDSEAGACWMKNVVLDLVGDWYAHDNWNTYVYQCSQALRPCNWAISDDFSVAHVEAFGDTQSVESSEECLALCERLPECVSASYNKNANKCSFSKGKPAAHIDHGEFVSFTCDRKGTDTDVGTDIPHPCDDVTMNACDTDKGQCVKRYNGATLTRAYFCICDDDVNETTSYDYTCLKGCEPPYAGHTCTDWESFNYSAYSSWQAEKAQEDYWSNELTTATALVAELQVNLTAAVQAVAAAATPGNNRRLNAVVIQLAVAQESLDSANAHFSAAETATVAGYEAYVAANASKAHKDSGAPGPHRIFGITSQLARRARTLGAEEPAAWTRQCVPHDPVELPEPRRLGTLSAFAAAGKRVYHTHSSALESGAARAAAGVAAVAGVAAIAYTLLTDRRRAAADPNPLHYDRTAAPAVVPDNTIDI